MDIELKHTGHRPYPLPASPWLMTQTWEHVLFMHWKVPEQLLREHIPPELGLDTFNGSAWISILPFRITHQRLRGMPEVPLFRTHLQLNVRTYVKLNGYQGIYLLSPDVNHLLAVFAAKALAVPYHNAFMNQEHDKEMITYKSQRIFSGSQAGNFSATLKPKACQSPSETVPGSLDHWLLERYCLFTKWGNHILRGDIHHEKWKICKTEASIL